MKQEDLKILIDKFMSGTTTLDEEKALGDFFRQDEHVPAELDPYRASLPAIPLRSGASVG